MNDETATSQRPPPVVTLKELCLRTYPTIKAFAAVWGASPGKVSLILQGRYNMALSPDEVRRLAHLFGVTFQAITEAMAASYEQWRQRHHTT